MNGEPQPSVKNKNALPLITAVAVLALTGAVIWLVFSLNHLVDRVGSLEKDKADAADTSQPQAPNYTNLTSGKGGFTMVVPEGWGPLIKDTTSDFFLLPGMQQPTLGAGAVTEVRSLAGYGSDSASLFAVILSKDGWGETPRGGVEDFTIGKGEDALIGKKYSYIYPKDDTAGIGYLRSQNDRDYLYTFATKDGRKLDVIYSVYGSDPRNLVPTVDEIVRSIVVN